MDVTRKIEMKVQQKKNFERKNVYEIEIKNQMKY